MLWISFYERKWYVTDSNRPGTIILFHQPTAAIP